MMPKNCAPFRVASEEQRRQPHFPDLGHRCPDARLWKSWGRPTVGVIRVTPSLGKTPRLAIAKGMTLALWYDLAIPRIVGWKSLTVEAAPAQTGPERQAQTAVYANLSYSRTGFSPP